MAGLFMGCPLALYGMTWASMASSAVCLCPTLEWPQGPPGKIGNIWRSEHPSPYPRRDTSSQHGLWPLGIASCRLRTKSVCPLVSHGSWRWICFLLISWQCCCFRALLWCEEQQHPRGGTQWIADCSTATQCACPAWEAVRPPSWHQQSHHVCWHFKGMQKGTKAGNRCLWSSLELQLEDMGLNQKWRTQIPFCRGSVINLSSDPKSRVWVFCRVKKSTQKSETKIRGKERKPTVS